MKLLLTNDDGIEAPGLRALAEVAASFGEPIIVAPCLAHSGCSHRVTTDRPVRLIAHGPAWYALEGTPADCVRIGLHAVAPDAAWVLAGLNEGGNLGVDVHHSGTVAAVREAVLHGRPGIALSHYHRRGWPLDWSRAGRLIEPLLADLLNRPWTAGTFWNINLPHLPAHASEPRVVFCPLEPAPLPLAYRREEDLLHYAGDYHERPRSAGSDVDVCFNGDIAVTEVRLF
jgi:5'-nucleotidase